MMFRKEVCAMVTHKNLKENGEEKIDSLHYEVPSFILVFKLHNFDMCEGVEHACYDLYCQGGC